MAGLRRVVRARLHDPVFMRKFHGWAAVIWFVVAWPWSIFLSSWIPGLVFLSLYTIVTGHWGGWQATAAEIKADDELPNDP